MSSPWVPSVDVDVIEEEHETQGTAPTGPTAPQPTAPVVDVIDRLAQVDASGTPLPSAWIVGTHGGAGETTLAQLLPDAIATGHRWPVGGLGAPVILAARTHMPGLLAAQRAVMEWASGSAPVALAGIVLVADAPGKLPRPLRDFAQVVTGGAPNTWSLPWVEDWRLGIPPDRATAPGPIRTVLEDITSTITR